LIGFVVLCDLFKELNTPTRYRSNVYLSTKYTPYLVRGWTVLCNIVLLRNYGI